MSVSCTTRFFAPCAELSRYFTSYYYTEIACAPGETAEDIIHPEWASARYVLSGECMAGLVGEELERYDAATVTGPTDRAVRISCSTSRILGLGLSPLGWYRFVGCSAERWANKAGSSAGNPEFIWFGKIAELLNGRDVDGELIAEIEALLLGGLPAIDPFEDEAENLHAALVDPDCASVAAIALRLGLSMARLERLCRRVFGFTPKKLLARQRFSRTLGTMLTAPTQSWLPSIDPQYYDQAHFSRDFRRFMGMTPKAYLAMPKPISSAGAAARASLMGAPLQALHASPPTAVR